MGIFVCNPTSTNKTKHNTETAYLYSYVMIFKHIGEKILQLSNQIVVKLRTWLTTVDVFISSTEMPRKTVRMSNLKVSKGECT